MGGWRVQKSDDAKKFKKDYKPASHLISGAGYEDACIA